jgi:hypothetical protein
VPDASREEAIGTSSKRLLQFAHKIKFPLYRRNTQEENTIHYPSLPIHPSPLPSNNGCNRASTQTHQPAFPAVRFLHDLPSSIFVCGARSTMGYQENDFPKTSVATTQVSSVKMTFSHYDDFPPTTRRDTPEQHCTVLSKR